MKTIKRYVECSCQGPEHTLRFELDYNEPFEVCVGLYLNQHNGFFKRIWFALKYVFGVKQYEGHFDATMLEQGQIEELVVLFADYKKLNDAFIAKNHGLTPLTDEEVYSVLRRVVALKG